MIDLKKFYNYGYIKTFLVIEQGDYIYKIASKTSLTYSHVFKLIKFFIEEKYLTMNRAGRKSLVRLTEKGKIIQEKLTELNDELLRSE